MKYRKNIAAFLGLLIIFFYCTGAANLLFKTGFENGARTWTYFDKTGIKQWWTRLEAQADTNNWIFPDSLASTPFSGEWRDGAIQYQANRYSDATGYTNLVLIGDITPYSHTYFRKGIGHAGDTTTYLVLRTINEYEEEFIGATGLGDLGVVRSSGIASLDSVADQDIYMSVWIRLPTYFDSMLAHRHSAPDSTYNWTGFPWESKRHRNEWCASIGYLPFGFDTRLQHSLNWSSGSGLFQRVLIETVGTYPSPPAPNDSCAQFPAASAGHVWKKDIPKATNWPPLGSWFKYEIYLEESQKGTDNGRMFIRMNGDTIVDTTGIWTYKDDAYGDKWTFWSAYIDTGVTTPPDHPNWVNEIWFDDIEIWDSIPPP